MNRIFGAVFLLLGLLGLFGLMAFHTNLYTALLAYLGAFAIVAPMTLGVYLLMKPEAK